MYVTSFTQTGTFFKIIHKIFGRFPYSMSYTVLKYIYLRLVVSVYVLPVCGLMVVTRSSDNFTITFYLGVFVNLLKVVISFAITVRPSVGMKQLRSLLNNFHKSLYWGVFLKSV